MRSLGIPQVSKRNCEGLVLFPDMFALLARREEDDIEERNILEGRKRNARWENAKGYPKVVFEGTLFLLSLYMIPPLELTKDMTQLQYHAYCEVLGFSVSKPMQ